MRATVYCPVCKAATLRGGGGECLICKAGESEPVPKAKVWANAITRHVEEVAREEAERQGYDLSGPHGLFIAMMTVIVTPALWREALDRFRAEQGQATES